MSVTALSQLPPPRARAVLRTWIDDSGFQLPDTARLDRILQEMLTAREDRNPMVHWADVELRRYRDRLYLMPALQLLNPATELEWDGEGVLELPSGLGTLALEPAATGISRKAWELGPVTVRFRAGGERCRPLGRDSSKGLKKLFQELGVPPWIRSRTPLVMIAAELAAVGDLWVCDRFQAEDADDALRVVWRDGPG